MAQPIFDFLGHSYQAVKSLFNGEMPRFGKLSGTAFCITVAAGEFFAISALMNKMPTRATRALAGGLAAGSVYAAGYLVAEKSREGSLLQMVAKAVAGGGQMAAGVLVLREEAVPALWSLQSQIIKTISAWRSAADSKSLFSCFKEMPMSYWRGLRFIFGLTIGVSLINKGYTLTRPRTDVHNFRE